MSHEVVRAAPGAMPAISQRLDSLIDPQRSYGNGEDRLVISRGRITQNDVNEAKQALRRIEDAWRPATPEAVFKWLLPLCADVRNPPTKDECRIRAASLADKCQTMPAAVFSAEAYREAARKFAWWPSIADLVEHLDEYARPYVRTRLGLQDIVQRGPDRSAEPERMAPSDEEKEAVAVQLRSLISEFRERAEKAQPMRARPLHLTPEQLAAARQAQGIKILGARS